MRPSYRSHGRVATIVFSLAFLIMGMVVPPPVQSAGESEFALGLTDCNGNTLEMSDCMSQGADNADRWLQAVFASHLRVVKEAEQSVRAGGQNYEGYAPVDKLRKSQQLFEEYRQVASEFAYEEAYPGSIRQLRLPATRYYMTIDRVRDLLISCGYIGRRDDLPKTVDLRKTDWCESQ